MGRVSGSLLWLPQHTCPRVAPVFQTRTRTALVVVHLLTVSVAQVTAALRAATKRFAAESSISLLSLAVAILQPHASPDAGTSQPM